MHSGSVPPVQMTNTNDCVNVSNTVTEVCVRTFIIGLRMALMLVLKCKIFGCGIVWRICLLPVENRSSFAQKRLASMWKVAILLQNNVRKMQKSPPLSEDFYG